MWGQLSPASTLGATCSLTRPPKPRQGEQCGFSVAVRGPRRGPSQCHTALAERPPLTHSHGCGVPKCPIGASLPLDGVCVMVTSRSPEPWPAGAQGPPHTQPLAMLSAAQAWEARRHSAGRGGQHCGHSVWLLASHLPPWTPTAPSRPRTRPSRLPWREIMSTEHARPRARPSGRAPYRVPAAASLSCTTALLSPGVGFPRMWETYFVHFCIPGIDHGSLHKELHRC